MQRVGWIRMGALGDLLVGLASLREVIDRWPQAKVSVIGPKLWLEILEPGYWPQIDQIVVIERKKPGAAVYRLELGSHRKWSQISNADWTLRAEMASGYSVIFNTRVDSPREAFPAFWARVPERWGTAQGLGKFIYNRRASHYGKDPLIHERDVPLLLQEEAEVHSRLRNLNSMEKRQENSELIAKWRKVGLPCPRQVSKDLSGKKLLLVNPTSSRREKAWPSEKFHELILELRKNSIFQDVDIQVIGSPSETAWLQEVARDQFPILQPSGIGDLFRAVARASVLVTNTSSVQFIAAATGTPALTLMGRARPEIWGPLGPRDAIVRGQEPANVESLFERERLAYESIAVPQVLEKVVQLFRSIER